MGHLEMIVHELAGFGSATTRAVYSQTLPYRALTGPDACSLLPVWPALSGEVMFSAAGQFAG
jgi:hypothetical protein